MHKPRETGTSGPPWSAANKAHARKMARLHRLKAKGLTPPTDKASLRAAANLAASTHPIKRR